MVVSVDPGELLSKPLVEESAIREPRQRIGQGDPLEEILVRADDVAEAENMTAVETARYP